MVDLVGLLLIFFIVFLVLYLKREDAKNTATPTSKPNNQEGTDK